MSLLYPGIQHIQKNPFPHFHSHYSTNLILPPHLIQLPPQTRHTKQISTSPSPLLPQLDQLLTTKQPLQPPRLILIPPRPSRRHRPHNLPLLSPLSLLP